MTPRPVLEAQSSLSARPSKAGSGAVRHVTGLASLNIAQETHDCVVENIRVLDVRDVAGLLDREEARALDGSVHLPRVLRRRAMVLAAADEERRAIDLAKPVAIVEPRERGRAAAIAKLRGAADHRLHARDHRRIAFCEPLARPAAHG